VDGNKRIAVTMTAAFLRVNGYRLDFDDLDALSFLIDLYETERLRFEELDRWLRQHAVAASPFA
jgi:prophage maintenance system killer protein